MRVFPMSSSITPERAAKISKELGELKAAFDGTYVFGITESIGSRPAHVPK